MNIEYKKINLRNFRQNLTQLKDSLNAGQAYEVIDRGKTLAYFIPSEYEVKVNKKTKSTEEIERILTEAIGCVHMSEKKKKTFDYDKEYRKAMEKKHLR
jgi:antitoxin (DNA-binding transcriptional repressor) of toxin-antitoxin stability system